MFHVVTGGSGSGKSAYAEDRIVEYAGSAAARGSAGLYYIATMMPFDEETKERIRRHQTMRAGKGFQTVECYRDLKKGLEDIFCGSDCGEENPGTAFMCREHKASILLEGTSNKCQGHKPSVLLECMSNLVANELFSEPDCGDRMKKEYEAVCDQVTGAIMEGIHFLRERCAILVVVTNEVFSECAQDSQEMRLYKKILGRVNQKMADLADQVTEVVYGIPEDVKKGLVERARDSEGRNMRMIIGGAYQGKLAYAKALYPDIDWADGRCCEEEALVRCGGIYHFESYIARMLRGEFAGGDGQTKISSAEEFCQYISEQNPGLIIVSDEIGYGLVPIDAFDRKYREETGRICTRLAEFADRVDRVVCGVGTVIKGGEER
ncbi:bifunctional adenosylcobinamide kinase/adenosylcobinamide-phosphate guanylyltransferase [Roseburia hominis]